MSDESTTLRERALAYLRDEANGFHLYNHPTERALARVIGCSKTHAHNALVIWRSEADSDGPSRLRWWGQGKRAADRATADEIRLKNFQGQSKAALAREYGLGIDTITRIVRRTGAYALDIGIAGE